MALSGALIDHKSGPDDNPPMVVSIADQVVRDCCAVLSHAGERISTVINRVSADRLNRKFAAGVARIVVDEDQVLAGSRSGWQRHGGRVVDEVYNCRTGDRAVGQYR